MKTADTTQETNAIDNTVTSTIPSLSTRKGGALWVKNGNKGKYLSLQIELNGQKYNLLGLENQYFAEDPENKPRYTLHWTPETFTNINKGKGIKSVVAKTVKPVTEPKEVDVDI